MRRFCFILMIVFSCICAFSVYKYWSIMQDYAVGQETYESAVETYVVVEPSVPEQIVSKPVKKEPEIAEGPIEEVEIAPIQIDFESLLNDCPDIQGWIWCEGTSINYPVVQGDSNTEYLRHTYLGDYAVSGSIFVDWENAPGFQDVNNIIYGHCMKDGTMFACLSKWSSQEFYDEHPVIWLLTPEQDYKIEILSGYVTHALSGVHTIYKEASEDFTSYLQTAIDNSSFIANTELDENARYVVLSTCAYTFEDARYVVHGKLVPVGG